MKKQTGIVFLLSMIVALFASATAYVDSDSVAVQNHIQQARLEGKNLLVISSASWCPGCGQIAQGLKENPDLVTELKKNNRIIDIEEMNANQGLQHYFPIRQFFYPLLMVYNTQKNTWTYINGDFDLPSRRLLIGAIMNQIDQAAQGVDLLGRYFEIFQANVANNVAFDDSQVGAVASYNFQELIMRVMIDADALRAIEVMKSVLVSIRSQPQLFPHMGETGFDWNHYVLTNGLFNFIAKGLFTYDQVVELFPGYAVGTGSTSEDFPAFSARLNPVLYAIESQLGLAAAAQMCETETTAFFATLAPETPKYKVGKYKNMSFCHLLSVQAGLESSSDYAIWSETGLQSLTDKEVDSVRDMVVDRLVTVGEFAYANKNIDYFIAKESARYSKNLASAQSELQDAISADDREAIESIKKDIEGLGIVHDRNVVTFTKQKSSWAVSQKVSSINADY